MKKLFLSLGLFCVLSFVMAQDSLENSNYFLCTIGRSFPVGDFASDNIDKLNSGMAKNGWSIAVKYAHRFDELLGFSSVFLYAQFPLKNTFASEGPSASIKPLDYYELMIGPLITGAIGKKISLDLSISTGVAYINVTKVNLNGATVAKKYPASAIPLNCSIDLRYQLNSRWYFVGGIDYNYMRANMNVTTQSQDLSFKESLNSVSISSGFGINFQ